jgi:Zn-dependent M28 family amino/carboxypeptidase
MATVRSSLAALLAGALAACSPDSTSAPVPAPVAPAADVAAAPVAAAAAVPAFRNPPLSAEALLEHVRTLSSDEFEGRKPATRGEELTLAYLSRTFEDAGLKPAAVGADGKPSWLQEVPLVSLTVTGSPVLTVTGADGAKPYTYATQFVAWSKRVQPQVQIADAPIVFVGFGIVTPDGKWNDYAGVDMKGKIALMLINDPDFGTDADGGFGGRAMTYYGRWTYKYEEAARQGAAGAIIVHETAPASYPWAVVQSSNTSGRLDVVREDNGMSRAAVEGWVTEEIGRELFTRAGLDFAEQKARAQKPGFKPVELGLKGSLALDIKSERTTSHNVVGILPGAGSTETVAFGAHWDHLGRCTPVDGDGICNGALDNATGTAGLIELARRASAQGAARRSLLFIAFTAEEQGLLGSQYYADHPAVPPRDTVAMINMDGLGTYGPSKSVLIVGSGKSEMDDLFSAVAEKAGRTVKPDQFPERGSFFRSDQFHFARVGVPVLYTDSGIDLVNGGEERGKALDEAYIASRYHKPQDEIQADWDMSGAAQDLELLYQTARGIADGSTWPQWRADAEFREVRTKQGR